MKRALKTASVVAAAAVAGLAVWLVPAIAVGLFAPTFDVKASDSNNSSQLNATDSLSVKDMAANSMARLHMVRIILTHHDSLSDETLAEDVAVNATAVYHHLNGKYTFQQVTGPFYDYYLMPQAEDEWVRLDLMLHAMPAGSDCVLDHDRTTATPFVDETGLLPMATEVRHYIDLDGNGTKEWHYTIKATKESELFKNRPIDLDIYWNCTAEPAANSTISNGEGQ